MTRNSDLTLILVLSILFTQQVWTHPATSLSYLKEMAEIDNLVLNLDEGQQKILVNELSKLLKVTFSSSSSAIDSSNPLNERQDNEIDDEEIILPSDIALPQVTQLVGAVLKGQLNITTSLFHKNKINIPSSIRNPVKSIVKLLNSITKTSLAPVIVSQREKTSEHVTLPTPTEPALKDVDWVIIPTYNVPGEGSTMAPTKLNPIKNSYRVRTKNRNTTTTTTVKPLIAASSHVVVYNFEDYANEVQQWGPSFGQHGGGTFF